MTTTNKKEYRWVLWFTMEDLEENLYPSVVSVVLWNRKRDPNASVEVSNYGYVLLIH